MFFIRHQIVCIAQSIYVNITSSSQEPSCEDLPKVSTFPMVTSVMSVMIGVMEHPRLIETLEKFVEIEMHIEVG